MTAAIYATRDDVEEIVGRVVGEIIGDALQMISERFDRVDERFDRIDQRFDRVEGRLGKLETDMTVVKGDIKDLSTIMMRVDNRLDDTVEKVDTQAANLRLIQRKIA